MKTVLYHSNNSKAFTGFGKHCKNMLRYLQKTGKYKLVEFANGMPWGDPNRMNKPWTCQGSLPNNPSVIQQLNANPDRGRAAGYGAEMIDLAIKEYKPDVYIGVEDIWGFSGFWDKPWWNKINHMIWTTLDSQPILPQAIEAAPKTKNFFAWSSFAEKDLKAMGHDHVGTLHGSINTEDFYKLSDIERHNLRQSFNLSDEFIIGFVFRNQLRKSVPNLLDGFKAFKKDCPKAKLFLHTNWSEGWDIPRLIKEKGINNSDILTTYCCKNCGFYSIAEFQGQGIDCPVCGAQKSLNTTNIQHGVNEKQLNEIYNLMDVYCHPFTSGGMEIPIFEAKLTELITLVTNYSCGEDSCTPESGGLPLEWAEYREPGTQFIKASTYASSIAKQLKKVWQMKQHKKYELGKKARQFTIDNYSIDVIGKKLEDIIDNMPDVDYEYDWDKEANAQKTLDDHIDTEKSIAVVIPGGELDIIYVNSTLEEFKKIYEDYSIYVFTNLNFAAYIEDNPAVYKVLPYSPEIDDPLFLEGYSTHKGYFDMAFFPHHLTQRVQNYIHNGKDKNTYSPCQI